MESTCLVRANVWEVVVIVVEFFTNGASPPSTYKSMSLVPPFGDVGAHVQ